MHLQNTLLGLITLCISAYTAAAPTELDHYLIQKQITDSKHVIKNADALNEILDVISDEDSRTMPYQIDQNTIIEDMRVFADHTDFTGLITSSDFTQFAADIGQKEVKKLIYQNMLQNCNQFFEHEFQKRNPYYVQLTLTSDKQTYISKLKNTECQFK